MRTLNPFHLILAMLFCIGQVSAQTYIFTVESEDYEPIQGGQDVVGSTWNDPHLVLPIGFDFEFFTKTIQEITLPSFFSIISILDDGESDIANVFILLGADLADRGLLDGTHLSPIKTVVTGNVGSRVFTLEFQNAGFLQDLFLNGSSTDFINLQMKLYEENGDIVWHFGPRLVSMPQLAYVGFDGPFMGLAEDFDLVQDVVNGEIMLLSGDPLDPVIVTEYGEFSLSSTIPANTLYRFSRELVGAVNNVRQTKESYYYPNPATGQIQVNEAFRDEVISPVDLYGIDGRFVRRFVDHSVCDLEGLSSGLYELRFESHSGLHSERLIVLPE